MLQNAQSPRSLIKSYQIPLIYHYVCGYVLEMPLNKEVKRFELRLTSEGVGTGELSDVFRGVSVCLGSEPLVLSPIRSSKGIVSKDGRTMSSISVNYFSISTLIQVWPFSVYSRHVNALVCVFLKVPVWLT